LHQRQRAAGGRRAAAGAPGLGRHRRARRGAAARRGEALRRLSPLRHAQGLSVMSFESAFNPHSETAQARRAAMLERIAQLRAIEARAAAASAQSKPVFDKRGQLLPRERIALLIDPGAPWLPLCSIAGFLQDTKDPSKSVA